ncbi:hypothetical protein LEMLEM_LOCUS20912, partial [Lemmus lemmus]
TLGKPLFHSALLGALLLLSNSAGIRWDRLSARLLHPSKSSGTVAGRPAGWRDSLASQDPGCREGQAVVLRQTRDLLGSSNHGPGSCCLQVPALSSCPDFPSCW